MSKPHRPTSSLEAKAERVAVVAAKGFVLLILLYLIVMLATGGFRGGQQQNAAAALGSAQWLTGSWVRAPSGGEDGNTACSDFNARELYQQNRNTGQIISFYPTGAYRALFAYSTPTGNEHSTLTMATWRLADDRLTLSDVTIKDAFTGAGDPQTMLVEAVSDNVLSMRSDDTTMRLVRCQGDPTPVYGE